MEPPEEPSKPPTVSHPTKWKAEEEPINISEDEDDIDDRSNTDAEGDMMAIDVIASKQLDDTFKFPKSGMRLQAGHHTTAGVGNSKF